MAGVCCGLAGALDNGLVRQGVDADRILEQAQEEKTSPPRTPSIEAEAKAANPPRKAKTDECAAYRGDRWFSNCSRVNAPEQYQQ